MFHLLDLDHTIANSFWRDSMIGSVPWDEYHAASRNDKPFQKMVDLINALITHGDLIIAITGRTENHRGLTLNWLISNNILIHDLLMRPEKVFLKNAEMKVKLVSDYFNNYFDSIGFLIDDNEETILAFQKLGIATLQVRMIP
jgi:hypothetical protein